MMACFAGANFFHFPWLVFAWAVVALCLGIYWEIKDREIEGGGAAATSSPPLAARRSPKFLNIAIPASGGIFAAALVAVADLSVTRSTGVTMSLLGIPYFLPLGAIAWGVMAASGYGVGLKLVGRHPSSSDCYFMVGAALLALLLIKSIAVYVPHSLIDTKMASALIGLAPWPQVTLFLQVIGFALGGTIAFLLAEPISKPWSR